MSSNNNKTEVENNVYEVTNLTIGIPPNSSSSRPEISCETIEIMGGARALLLRNVLSKEESQFYIQQAEDLGLKSVTQNGKGDFQSSSGSPS